MMCHDIGWHYDKVCAVYAGVNKKIRFLIPVVFNENL